MVRINLIPGTRRQILVQELWEDVFRGLLIGLVITTTVCGYLIATVVAR